MRATSASRWDLPGSAASRELTPHDRLLAPAVGARQVAARQPVQLVVHQGDQGIERLAVTLAPVLEQARDLVTRHHRMAL